MGFLIPSALAFAALAIPIIIFYMLKLRRQPARVSSLMLWLQVIEDRQANSPWQKLKRNILLLLQLLILALLVMALARPYFTVEAKVQGNLIILLDASASMQAVDILPTRFDAARKATIDLINRLGVDDAVTLIAVGNSPHVLVSASTDRNILHRALAETLPGSGTANWVDAITLAAANASTMPDTTIVIIGDGGVGHNALNSLNSLPVPLEFIPIGSNSDNQGITVFSLRDGSNGPELFFHVANYSLQPARRLAEIYIDGQLFDARQIDIPAQDSASLTFSGLPLNAQHVWATLTGTDALPLDDTAWAVRTASPSSVLLVSKGNFYMERALALLPSLELQRAAPGQSLPLRQFDLVIFDRTLPLSTEHLPEGSLFFIAPPTSTSLFDVRGVITKTKLTTLNNTHPILSYVEFNNLHIFQAQAVIPPTWAETLVAAEEGRPLLIAGQVEGRRVAVLSFALHKSDLPLQIDFPILMVNLTRWLLPGEQLEQRQTLRAGQGFELPAASSADSLTIQKPSGERVTISSDIAAFDDTAELGIYQIFAQKGGDNRPVLLTEFVVNLLSEEETAIQPVQIKTASGSNVATGEKILTGNREWWWLLAGLGLAVLLVEWWVYWRGEVK